MPEEESQLLKVYETVVGRIKDDMQLFGTKGVGFIGKHIVGTGEDAHLTTKVLIDLLRPHIILISGKRGCVTEDTPVFTDHGYKQIKDFDWLKDKIYTWNPKAESFEWSRAHLAKYPIDEEVFEVELDDGRKIKMTSEHPLLAFENGINKWKKSDKMKVNDRLVVKLKVPEVSNDKESERIARLLGFILADGSIYVKKGRWKDGRGYWFNGTLKRLRIFNANEKVLERAKKDLEEEFGIKVRLDKRKTKDKILQTNQSKVVDKFIELGIPVGLKAGIIRVPQIVWESSNNFKSKFLSALFSCDGYVDKNGFLVYYSKSKKFVEDVQLLLNHFNILSTLRPKIVKLKGRKFLNYALYTSDSFSVEKFKKIGLIHDKKNERLQNHIVKKYKMKKRVKFFTEELAGIKIRKISKINGIKEVYDLNVPKTHSFLANGIISHNTGKSYVGGILMEEIAMLPEEFRKNIAVVVIDTMGIFWSMKRPNEQQLDLLRAWNLEPRGFDNVKVLVPFKQLSEFKSAGIPVDDGISILPWEFSAEEWTLAFNLQRTDPASIALEKSVNDLVEQKGKFGIEDLIEKVRDDREVAQNVKDALSNMLTVAAQWGVFGTEGVDIEKIVQPGQISVVDVSRLKSTEAWSVRNFLVATIAKKIYEYRVLARKEEEIAKLEGTEMKKKYPIVWLIADECHNWAPSDYETVSSEPFRTIAKQGREPGVSLVAITQMPNKIHQDILSQADMVISHRLTSKADIDALYAVMQTYLLESIWKYINSLPRWPGSAIILDDNLEKIFSVNIRPRLSWHAGGTAIVI